MKCKSVLDLLEQKMQHFLERSFLKAVQKFSYAKCNQESAWRKEVLCSLLESLNTTVLIAQPENGLDATSAGRQAVLKSLPC